MQRMRNRTYSDRVDNNVLRKDYLVKKNFFKLKIVFKDSLVKISKKYACINISNPYIPPFFYEVDSGIRPLFEKR